MSLLEQINNREDLHKLSVEQLCALAGEIRDFITESVSQTGGHLASNLGVVELTIALHYVFDFKSDKLLWDVGHQCYAHKIITGRRKLFDRLRMGGGLSGFPNPQESPYDVFTVGHAGTSIATALGIALGAQQKNSREKIVAVVGDASIVNGLSFEAMNNLSLVKRQLLIVLNDNSMAIDVTRGALAKFFAKVRLSNTYDEIRRTTNNILEHLPVIGKGMEDALESFKKTLRMTISPSRLFESLNIEYFGPVDGHDIDSLIKIFRAMAELEKPALLHIYTKKGKGYTPAGNDPRRFHSTGPFEVNGKVNHFEQSSGKKTFTSCFGDALVKAAEKDSRIAAITAAMVDGTGLTEFAKRFPERFYDVGIAESAAVDIAAGLAKQGFKPVVCIYSTFLQRSFDQIFQEVSLQDLPVVFCIDRAGVVGSDGATHHGMMDIGFMRMMPNLELIAPADKTEISSALEYALACDKSVAIRYPKSSVPELSLEVLGSPFAAGQSVTVRSGGSNIVFAVYGAVLKEVLEAAKILSDEQIDVTVINARFAKPIDRQILEHLEAGRTIITVEDHSIACGFGSALRETAGEMMLEGKLTGSSGKIISLGGPDSFIEADTRDKQLCRIGIDAFSIAEAARRFCDNSA